jgi:hypothetical protein
LSHIEEINGADLLIAKGNIVEKQNT